MSNFSMPIADNNYMNPYARIVWCTVLCVLMGIAQTVFATEHLPIKEIRVSFIVDVAHHSEAISTISDADIQQTIEYANISLLEHAQSQYFIKEIIRQSFAENTIDEVVSGYLDALYNDQPDYVVVLSKTESSVSHGGHTLGPYYGHPERHCNQAGATLYPQHVVYGAILDWGHLIGDCGYEQQDLQKVHVSATSFGGQCRNQSDLECVYAYNEWQCPNLLEDPETIPIIQDRRLFTAKTLNHELMHFFGAAGHEDHSCPENAPSDVQDASAWNMCGRVIMDFRAASSACPIYSLGDGCTHKNQCAGAYCHGFDFTGLSGDLYQCSVACLSALDCPSRLGKEVQCLHKSPTNWFKACYYSPSHRRAYRKSYRHAKREPFSSR
jgi:hypothetical protein